MRDHILKGRNIRKAEKHWKAQMPESENLPPSAFRHFGDVSQTPAYPLCLPISEAEKDHAQKAY